MFTNCSTFSVMCGVVHIHVAESRQYVCYRANLPACVSIRIRVVIYMSAFSPLQLCYNLKSVLLLTLYVT